MTQIISLPKVAFLFLILLFIASPKINADSDCDRTVQGIPLKDASTQVKEIIERITTIINMSFVRAKALAMRLLCLILTKVNAISSMILFL